MKYEHILTAFAAEPWAMQPEKLEVLVDFLAFKASGGEYSADEVAARITKAKARDVARREGSVAIIPVHGVLSHRVSMLSEVSGGTSYQGLTRDIHSAISSDEVKAVVLDVDSPGGAVYGAQELSSEILGLRGGGKPIVAQVSPVAASAAYWIASAADEIVVTPSGKAGSIGVYAVHNDLSKALEQAGVSRSYIHAGKFKVETEAGPLGDDARKHIQDGVDRAYRSFVDSVAAGRGVSSTVVEDRFGQGRIYNADELVERGMADRIATIDETLERFGASVTPEPVRRIKAANAAQAQAAETLIAKVKSGDKITIREFEHGFKGLAGLSNSEAERFARLCFKSDQGEPDTSAEKQAALAALERLLAQVRA